VTQDFDGTPDVDAAVEGREARAGDEEPRQRRLSQDTVFEALANSRRRAALHYLDDNDGTADIGDLAEHIAAEENGVRIVELDSSQRKRVYIGLYQCHLPKLDEMGIVDFDKHRGTVVLDGEAAAEVFPYLRLDPLAESEERGVLGDIRDRFFG
jgi:DNA-binding transcriptional ArsR family regulator